MQARQDKWRTRRRHGIVSVHAAETSIETLTERYLPLLLETADKISTDWTLFRHCLQITVSTTVCSNALL
jgi:hypothetical protein